MLTLANPQGFSPWSGTVVEVVRPDEIKVRKNENVVVNVRIYGIDSPLPQSGQFFGKEAMRYTMDRLNGKVVEVQPLPGRIEGEWYWPGIRQLDRLQWERSTRKYDRVIGIVYVDGESLGRELLTKGMAWWYRPFVPFERGYKHLEDLAREAKVGLWAYKDPVPPWIFQDTPVVDGRTQTREWVHFWVRKDEKDTFARSSNGGGSASTETETSMGDSKPPIQDSTPVMARATGESDTPLQSQSGASSSGAQRSPAPDQVTEAGKAFPPPPAAQRKSMPSCQIVLRELEANISKTGSMSLLKLEELLGPALLNCKRGAENLYCFKCLVIGQKTDSIEAKEEDGLISTYRYGGCGCSE